MIRGWLGSELLAEVRDAEARAGAPFALTVGDALVRGQIDLLVSGAGSAAGQLELLAGSEGDAAPTVIDFKTDRLDGTDPAALGDRYADQRRLYALALASVGSRAEVESVRAIHVFLDAPADPVVETFDAPRLAAARSQLEARVAAIRGGEFAPTNQPSHNVCFGCPAAQRLCPHPKWRPPR
jgi:hypothetical protein